MFVFTSEDSATVCLDLNYCLSISVFTKLQKQAINVNTNMGTCLSNDVAQSSLHFNFL